MNKCKQCRYYQAGDAAQAGGVAWGYCFLKPPVVFMMPQQVAAPRRIAQAQPAEMSMALVPVSVRPQVREAEFCAEFALTNTH